MKKILILGILCFVLTVSVLAEGIDYGNLSPEELQQLIADASSALEEKNGNTELSVISVDDLFTLYSENEAAADLKYTNNLVRIEDNVYDIDKEGKKYRVKLGDGGLFSNSIICYMKEDQISKIAGLEKDSDAVIEGICEGNPSWSIMYLKDCIIVD